MTTRMSLYSDEGTLDIPVKEFQTQYARLQKLLDTLALVRWLTLLHERARSGPG